MDLPCYRAVLCERVLSTRPSSPDAGRDASPGVSVARRYAPHQATELSDIQISWRDAGNRWHTHCFGVGRGRTSTSRHSSYRLDVFDEVTRVR